MFGSNIFLLALLGCCFAAKSESKAGPATSTKLKSLFLGKCIKPEKVQEMTEWAGKAAAECNMTSNEGKPYIKPCDELCLLEKFSVVKRSGNTTYELDMAGTNEFAEQTFISGFADALVKNLKDCSERRAISSTFEGNRGDHCKDSLSHIRCIRKQMDKTCKAVMTLKKKTAG